VLRPPPAGKTLLVPALTLRKVRLAVTMHSIDRWTARAFIAAGVAMAVWSGGHPWNQLAGAEVGGTLGWRIAHWAHFSAGMLLLLALLGLAARRRQLFGSTRGIAALLVAFTGSALFMAGGVFTAYIWPVLAAHAPHTIAADGPFLGQPDGMLFVTTITFAAGLILLGGELRRAGILDWGTRALLIVGPLLLLAAPPPIGPAPWALFAASGVVTGCGLVLAGRALARSTVVGPAAASAGERVPIRA
jgi:hypothetical protein